MALDEPDQDDIKETINGILVAIDPRIQLNTETLILDLAGDNSGLVLLGNTGNCC
ncbi:hypothetical protein [Peribacillus kribbensis]|uniref:hypothetical protein n=1 Tax=Peribacillus kribbensis TaxID=356658 RepID=UPI00041ED342|nr:hypothetical protein [Peribacillus kribbensis]